MSQAPGAWVWDLILIPQGDANYEAMLYAVNAMDGTVSKSVGHVLRNRRAPETIELIQKLDAPSGPFTLSGWEGWEEDLFRAFFGPEGLHAPFELLDFSVSTLMHLYTSCIPFDAEVLADFIEYVPEPETVLNRLAADLTEDLLEAQVDIVKRERPTSVVSPMPREPLPLRDAPTPALQWHAYIWPRKGPEPASVVAEYGRAIPEGVLIDMTQDDPPAHGQLLNAILASWRNAGGKVLVHKDRGSVAERGFLAWALQFQASAVLKALGQSEDPDDRATLEFIRRLSEDAQERVRFDQWNQQKSFYRSLGHFLPP